MPENLLDKISTIEEMLKQLKVRKLRIEQRQRSLSSKRERAADTRRKILVGALVVLPMIIGYTAFAYRVFWGKSVALKY